MKIDLSDVTGKNPKSRDVDVLPEECDIRIFSREEIVPGIEPFVLRLELVDGSRLFVHGRGKARFSLPCDRCLGEVIFDEEFEIDTTFDIAGDHAVEDDEDPLGVISENTLDVDLLISCEISLCIPAKVLCKEDCKGLCPKCGHDLNKGDCGCDRSVLDPRMAKFLDVFNGI